MMTGLAFGALSIHSFSKLPDKTMLDEMTPTVIKGKHLWDRSNCMGCHTLLGEGGYYAPELTKVYERRGPGFIRAMLEDPEAMYPGQRKMYRYDFNDEEIEALTAFLKWVGTMDLNGFPPKPVLFAVAAPGTDSVATGVAPPKVFNQMCIACHALGGQGGKVGPAPDGVGSRMSGDAIGAWLADPQKIKPKTTMPKLPLSKADISELSAFLTTLRETDATATATKAEEPSR